MIHATVTGDQSKLWLIDNALGVSRPLVEAQLVEAGTVSPGGCWIATAAGQGSAGEVTWSVSIQPLGDGEMRSIAELGFRPVWLDASPS